MRCLYIETLLFDIADKISTTRIPSPETLTQSHLCVFQEAFSAQTVHLTPHLKSIMHRIVSRFYATCKKSVCMQKWAVLFWSDFVARTKHTSLPCQPKHKPVCKLCTTLSVPTLSGTFRTRAQLFVFAPLECELTIIWLRSGAPSIIVRAHCSCGTLLAF